jgi:hypothetical protein
VLQNADLRLRSATKVDLSPEQQERRLIIFDLLVSLFERAYLLVYEERMNKQQRRLWLSWEDYMREWCRRDDFRGLLPQLLTGEDPDFAARMAQIAREEDPTYIMRPAGPPAPAA